MKIMYVYNSLAVWGGIERVLVDKMNYLVDKYGYDVTLITADQGSHPLAYQLDSRVHFYDFNICFYRRYSYNRLRRIGIYRQMRRSFCSQLAEKLQTVNPDVVICASTGFLSLIEKVIGRHTLLLESHCPYDHGLKELEPNFFRRLQVRSQQRYVRKTNGVVSLTSSDAAEWRSVNSNVYVIPNVVHLNPTGKMSQQTQKRVICAARLSWEKGIPDLIECWKLVQPQHPDWQLDIYGEGPLRAELEDIVARNGLRVSLHQPTTEIFEHYVESSILVVASTFEAFGLVMPEAMSCGLPVVAFNCPYGPKDIVADGQTGFLVEGRDKQQFAEKLSLLMSDQALRQRMSKAAIESSKRYEASNIMPQWKTLFEGIREKNSV